MNRGVAGFPIGRRKKVTNLKFVGCRVMLAGTVNVPTASGTAIPWDTILYNFGPCVELLAQPTRLTAPVEGWYEITTSVLAPEQFPTQARTFTDINFGTRLLARRDVTGAFRSRHVTSAVVFMRARQFVEISAWQNFGSTKTVGGATAADEAICCASFTRVG